MTISRAFLSAMPRHARRGSPCPVSITRRVLTGACNPPLCPIRAFRPNGQSDAAGPDRRRDAGAGRRRCRLLRGLYHQPRGPARHHHLCQLSQEVDLAEKKAELHRTPPPFLTHVGRPWCAAGAPSSAGLPLGGTEGYLLAMAGTRPNDSPALRGHQRPVSPAPQIGHLGTLCCPLA